MSTSDLTVAARLVAKLLAHRQTPQEEVGGVIRGVYGALSRLHEPVAVATEPVAEADEPQAAPVPRRKRRQPVEIAAAEIAAADEASPAVPPPAAKLVRRAEVMTTAPVAAAPPPALASAPQGAVRGVVKWFDPRAGKGALRLPGFAGDVLFEARILADSGIARLFKGQEIEATVDGGSGRPPQVQRIALPGSASATPVGTGVVHSRRAKPVLVELKREALRRAAARAEAEHLLGPNRSR
jgi:cold shock CspA family protein